MISEHGEGLKDSNQYFSYLISFDKLTTFLAVEIETPNTHEENES